MKLLSKLAGIACILLFSIQGFAQTFPIISTVLPNQTKNLVSSGLADNDLLTIHNTGAVSLRLCMAGSATATCGSTGIMVSAGATVNVTVAALGGVSNGNFLNAFNQSLLVLGSLTVDRTVGTGQCIPTSTWAPSCTTDQNGAYTTQYITTTAGVVEVGYANHQPSSNSNFLLNGNGGISQNLLLGGSGTTIDARLEIMGGKLFTSNGWQKAIKLGQASAIQFNTGSSQFFGIGASNGNQLYIFNAATETSAANYILKINSNGSVGIGTDNDPDPAYKLSVNGNIRAKKVVIETGWSDFVFAKDYKLMSLADLEIYINQNQHLPEIPSAKEVETNGAEVNEMLKKQMQKIEELTLYIIEQNKKIEELQKKVSVIERK